MNAIALGTALLGEIDESINADGQSAALDVTDYDGPITFFAAIKNISGTTPTAALKLVESATSGGSYTDVAGGTVGSFTTADGAGSDSIAQVTLDAAQLKGFVKLDLDLGGTSPVYAYTFGAYGRKKYTP